jgi:ComEC/Rec2-related protein
MPSVYAFLSEIGGVSAALFLVEGNTLFFISSILFSLFFILFQHKTIIRIATVILTIFVFVYGYASLSNIDSKHLPSQFINKDITFVAKVSDFSKETFKPDSFEINKIWVNGNVFYEHCRVYSRWHIPPPYSIVEITGKIIKNSDYTIIERINRNSFTVYANKVKILKTNKLFDLLSDARNKMTENTSLSMKSNEAFLLLSSSAGISTLTYEEKEPFIKTGTTHIFAVSGLHTSILGESVQKMFSFSNLTQAAPFISLFSIFLFLMIVGFRVSVLRAFIMYGATVIAKIRGEELISINTLAFAAMLIILFNPLALFSISFLFSFSAIFAITIIAPILIQHIPNNAATSLISQTISVQLVLAPLIAFYFHTFSLSAFIANFFVIPYMYIALPIGIIQSILSLISINAAKFFAPISNIVFTILFRTVRFFAKPSKSSINIHFKGVNLIIYFLLLTFFIASIKKWKKKMVVISATLLALSFAIPFMFTPAFHIYPLKLKGEDGFIIQKYKTVIYITSPTALKSEDSDTYAIKTALQENGVNSLKAMIFDTPFEDKESSSAKLVGQIPIENIILIKGKSDLTEAFQKVNGNKTKIKIVSSRAKITINGVEITFMPGKDKNAVLIKNNGEKYLLVGKYFQPVEYIPYVDTLIAPNGLDTSKFKFGKLDSY